MGSQAGGWYLEPRLGFGGERPGPREVLSPSPRATLLAAHKGLVTGPLF